MLALQSPDLLGLDEVDAELALLDSLGGEHVPRERDDALFVHGAAAAVVDLDGDHHRLRCVPDSSAWRLYASTIRCTSLCRTTSLCVNWTNPTPSTLSRIRCTWIRPDACSRGRSTCVTSPVTTIFDPKPSRVRNICICSGLVFCASSRITKESLSVRPRMNASGATSIVPRSMYALSFSGSIVS